MMRMLGKKSKSFSSNWRRLVLDHCRGLRCCLADAVSNDSRHAAAAASPTWPGTGVLQLAADRPTLLMFVHPECACSRASIGELQQLMTDCKNHVAVHLLFFKPTESTRTNGTIPAFWTDAKAIQARDVRIDPGGTVGGGLRRPKQADRSWYATPKVGSSLVAASPMDSGHFGDNAGLDAAIAIVGSAPHRLRRGYLERLWLPDRLACHGLFIHKANCPSGKINHEHNLVGQTRFHSQQRRPRNCAMCITSFIS